jgi:hypothetical protein
VRIFYAVLIGLAVLLLGFGVACVSQPEFLMQPLREGIRDITATDIDSPDVNQQRFERRMIAVERRMFLVGVGYIALGVGLIGVILTPQFRRFVSALAIDIHSLKRDVAISYQQVDSSILIGLAGLTALGFFLRMVYITQPLRGDEAFTYMEFAAKPWWRGISDYTLPNNHLFHTLLVHLTTRFGDSDILIRLPTFIGGVLLIPATYMLGTLLFSPWSALFAAGIVSVSSMIIEYSVNARGYTLQTLFFLIQFAAAVTLVQKPNRAAWVVFVISAALGFYTIPSMLYGFLVIMVWMGLCLLYFRQWWRIVSLITACAVTMGITMVLYSPVHIVSAISSVTSNPFVDALPMEQFLVHLRMFAGNLIAFWHRDMPLPFALLMAIGLCAAVVLHQRIAKHPVSLFPVLVGCCAALLIAQRVVPFERTWILFIPLYAIVASAGIEALVQPLVNRFIKQWHNTNLVTTIGGIFALLGIWLLASNGVYLSEETSTQRNTPELLQYLPTVLREGDALSVAPPSDYLVSVAMQRSGYDPDLTPLSDARRIWVIFSAPESVISELNRQLQWQGLGSIYPGGLTLDNYLRRLDSKVGLSKFSEPRRMLALPWAEVYLLERRETF